MQLSVPASLVSKKMLLDHHTEEEYMSFYLGVVPDKDMHCNPFRADKRPTCTFYRSKNGELIFKDWKTAYHANFVDVVMTKFNCVYARALKIIANDFGIIEKPDYEKNKPAVKYNGEIVDSKSETFIQAEIQDFTPSQLKWWLSFGIRQETLNKYHVFSVKSVFLNGNFCYSSSERNPIYGYYFGKDSGRELWKMYFPLKTRYRFLLNTNKLQGAKQLPATGDIVVVTKSLKDVMVLHEMGIPAVAPQAESVIISQRQYDALAKRFKYVIFNGDWDGAGQRFMSESRKKYKSIALSFTDKEKYGKDVSDFVKKYKFDKAHTYILKVKAAILAGRFDRQLSYCKSE